MFYGGRKIRMHYYQKKDANNEVTYDVPNYANAFNVFKRGREILDNLGVSYKRLYMVTPREGHLTEMLDHINQYNKRNGKQLSSKKLQEAVLIVME